MSNNLAIKPSNNLYKMSEFSNFFKNKKDKEDFYIASVVIIIFLIGGFYFGSSMMNEEAPIAFNDEHNTLSSQIENENFGFETAEDEQLTIAILKDEQKVKQLDNWLETTPTMDSLDVVEIVKEATAKENTAETNNTTTDDLTNQSVDSIEIDAVIEAEGKAEIEALLKLQEAEKAKMEQEAAKAKKQAEIEATLKAQETEKIRLEKEAAQAEANKKAAAEAKRRAKAKAIADAKAKEKARIASYNCTIIVGSFETAKPADDIKAQLIKQGYPAYTFFRKQLKVVGIKTSCNNEVALQKQLKKIRKTYPNAWVLRPE